MRSEVLDELERQADEAEQRYARTGLTIDAQRAVDARAAARRPRWRDNLKAQDRTGDIRRG